MKKNMIKSIHILKILVIIKNFQLKKKNKKKINKIRK